MLDSRRSRASLRFLICCSNLFLASIIDCWSSLGNEFEPRAVLVVDDDFVVLVNLLAEYELGQWFLDVLLYGALDRARSIGFIEAFFEQEASS